MRVVRHVSFVDCPGHDILMATMLNGAAVMDAAMLLIAGNEPCPQPQTSEHLAAVEIMQLQNIIILQNKIDLVKEEAAKAQHEQIKSFVSGTVAGNAPIIPISAQLKYNIDVVCKNIVNRIPIPVRDFKSAPRMIVIRLVGSVGSAAAVEDASRCCLPTGLPSFPFSCSNFARVAYQVFDSAIAMIAGHST